MFEMMLEMVFEIGQSLTEPRLEGAELKSSEWHEASEPQNG
jgi:hypothetical protein